MFYFLFYFLCSFFGFRPSPSSMIVSVIVGDMVIVNMMIVREMMIVGMIQLDALEVITDDPQL